MPPLKSLMPNMIGAPVKWIRHLNPKSKQESSAERRAQRARPDLEAEDSVCYSSPSKSTSRKPITGISPNGEHHERELPPNLTCEQINGTFERSTFPTGTVQSRPDYPLHRFTTATVSARTRHSNRTIPHHTNHPPNSRNPRPSRPEAYPHSR